MPSFQVTLPSANTNYELWSLVRAQDPAFIDFGEMTVQAEDDGGAQVFRLGNEPNLSDTRHGGKITGGDYWPVWQPLRALRGVYARCDTAGKKLNINVRR